MKRILTIAVILLAALSAKAQTVEVLIGGEQQKLFIEKTGFGKDHVAFAYLEASFKGEAMAKLFWEQKFWKAPAYIHAEFQTTFNGGNTYIVGGAYCFNLPHGSITLAPLYRFDGKHAFQASEINFFDWGWCELYCYNHFWYNGAPCFFGEERFHFKIREHIGIGVVVDLTYFGQFKATPYFGIRYKF